LVGIADFIIAASKVVADRKNSQYKTDKFKVIANPTSYKIFSRARYRQVEIAGELKKIPEPRIGYIGGIKELLDQELILYLAEKSPEISYVFVGDVEGNTNISQLKEKKNIYLISKKKYEDLPAYLVGFRLGIIPYVLNEHTASINPNKAAEYLMAGLEVVTVNIPELVDKMPDKIHIAENKEDFLKLIKECLSHKANQLTDLEMKELSWEKQINQITDKLNKKLDLERPDI
jgi:glycosyltransferase involved in cell wall biosynthesis